MAQRRMVNALEMAMLQSLGLDNNKYKLTLHYISGEFFIIWLMSLDIGHIYFIKINTIGLECVIIDLE